VACILQKQNDGKIYKWRRESVFGGCDQGKSRCVHHLRMQNENPRRIHGQPQVIPPPLLVQLIKNQETSFLETNLIHLIARGIL
jgi:hypothetical protein